MNESLTRRRQALARLPQSHRPYSVLNPAGPVAEIRIYDEIWFFGVNADDFARDLEAITAPEILVAINSPGGDVFDAIAIYNALRNHPARVTTRVDGIAASAASLIVQAGERRVMMSASQMMIHEPWGIVVGPASEIREFADLLDRQTDVLAEIYAGRSGRETAHFRDLMSSGSDVWMSDQEAVAEGLADEVSDPAPKSRASAASPAAPPAAPPAEPPAAPPAAPPSPPVNDAPEPSRDDARRPPGTPRVQRARRHIELLEKGL